MNKGQSAKLIFSARGLSKAYQQGRGRLEVLKDLSLDVYEGANVAIMGSSGSGKSTLLHILGGLDAPDSGKVNFCGQSLNYNSSKNLAALRGPHIGFVFQFHYLLAELTALENLLLPARLHGASSKQARDRALDLMQFLGILDRAHHYPSQMSGGERQRVAFGRALMCEPKVLIADEPTGSLDSKSSSALQELLFSVHRKWNLTMLVVTHDESLAARFSERLLLKGGACAGQPKV